ncbi:MAG: RluA family pseudouridine synthase [Lentisphaeria bacterium]|nr:RluA family pseudouridine synthase [Lentisphaeria bacterium]
MSEVDFTVAPEHQAFRLDRALAELLPDTSRTRLAELVKAGNVTVDGNVVTVPRFTLQSGMRLHVSIPEARTQAVSPEPFAFEILFEDPHLLVINKPAGVVVHPAAGNPDGTVVNALLGRYPGMANRFGPEATERPGIVHRLDKETSGCLAVAKTPDALFKLGAAFADRRTAKTYLAVCRGVPRQLQGELQTLIGRHPVNRQKMAVVERNGKPAHTAYKILAQKVINGVPLALAEVRIFTGRTHQIRVHMASLGLPVLGDAVYGRHTDFPGVERQMLHAWKLSLPHPVTGETLSFTAPIPADFERIKEVLLD